MSIDHYNTSCAWMILSLAGMFWCAAAPGAMIEIDPPPDVMEVEVSDLKLPFGASFIEDETPVAELKGQWPGEDSRHAEVELTITELPAGRGAVRRTATLGVELQPGVPSPLELAEAGSLPPGLYEINGDVRLGAVRQPLQARFAILSRELADRPQDGIPQWVGVVPLINLLPREEFSAGFEFMHRLGVRHVRWLPGWGRIEQEEGVYDWSESDLFMDLVEQHDMEAMFCLSYFGAEWTRERTSGQRARTNEGREMWVRNFAVPAIQRYGDRVKLWQIWNEPDAFWDDDPEKARGFAAAFATPANYYDLVKRTHEAGHALGIPDLRIMASLSSGNQMQNIRLLFDYGLGEHFDGLIIHTYGHHVQHFRNARRLLAELGHPDSALGSGEIGIPRGTDWDGEMRQAMRVMTVMLSSTTIDNLLCVHWFMLHDYAGGGNFGLIDKRLQPYASAVAYHTVARLMSGAQSGEIESRGLLTVFRVERKDRPPLVAVANPGHPTLLTFQVNGNEPPLVWDLLGRSSTPQINDGTFTLDLAEAIMIEGNVTPRTAVAPEVKMALAEDGRPVVQVVVGGGEELAAARIGLSVPELDYSHWKEVGAEGEAAFLLPTVLEPGRQYEGELTLSVAGSEVRQPTTIEATPVYRVDDEAVRSLTPPPHLPAIRISGEQAFRPLAQHRSYGGPEDNSTVIHLGWTMEKLVLWVEQQDDVHVPIPVGAPNPWGYDSGQWAIQPEGQLAPAAPFIEVTFGILEDGEPMARVMGQPHYDPDILAERRGTTTRYRITIPLAQIGLVPGHGVSLGTAVNLNDNDGDGRKGWIHWGEGIGGQKDPSRYRRIVLHGD